MSASVPRPADHAAFRARGRFGSLDGLRCLAIVPVVWHHATPRPLEGVLGRGPLGVDLFFVISGFLITTLLLRERAVKGRVDLRGFYVRRALRIFPLYFAVLGLYLAHALLARAPGDPIRTHFLESLPFYATFTASWLVRFDVSHPVAFGFSWSLSTEEQFYALWPSVIAAAGVIAVRWRAAAYLVPLVVAAALIGLDLAVESGGLAGLLPSGSLGRRVASSIATPIGLGALAALALAHRRSFGVLAYVLGSRLAAPVALLALLACVIVPAPPLPTHLAMTALVVATTVREDHGLAPVLQALPVARLGVVSYGIYLLHVSVITAVKAVLGRDVPALGVFVPTLVVSWVLAELSFRFFERPFLALKERLAGRRAPSQDAAAGPSKSQRLPAMSTNTAILP